jgi:nitrile hydratase accessory protein
MPVENAGRAGGRRAGGGPPVTAPLPIDGPAAPPRSNGASPWESRAFGLAVSLHDAGVFRWPDFQAALIARIAAGERAHPGGAGWSYYGHWLGALEDVLATSGVVPDDATATRAEQLAGREPGHDHH